MALNVNIVINDPGLRRLARNIAKTLESIATDLDEHTKNKNIARVTGGVVGVVGTAISVAGLVAMPLTAGLSAVVAGVGGGIAGAAGGLTAAGATITHMIIEKSKMKDAQKEWATFIKALEEALKGNPRLLQAAQDVVLANLTRLGLSTATVTTNVGAAVARASEATTSVAGAGGRIAAATVAGPVVVNVVLLGLSMFDMIDGSLELHRDRKSKAGDTLREFVESLKTFAQTGRLQ